MSSAVISPCGQYRYKLTRKIPSSLRWMRRICFIMLNPSTADASLDDPTIRRCIGFSKTLGYTDMTVVNLFAFRATEPDELVKAQDPIGPENDAYIKQELAAAYFGLIIAAWGAHPFAEARARSVSHLLTNAHALKTTKDGWPCHPLYLKADLKPQPWKIPEGTNK